ncbi:serine hydrolase domain-containing protein [Rhizomicrobium electricum]|uniref:Beta-lactamase-related domain-containing protein n=1 Tax=Rhizomicrobium electricum TaxID=480070 RepID=A0ABP3PLC3_9PROT|nr:serine hydrolase domain-containing protein [Rhizomicrobium electricum]NIJ48545.1 CubicO group peptidase (beta-lactamase class C family) [Rhizomicrobium electricum]
MSFKSVLVLLYAVVTMGAAADPVDDAMAKFMAPAHIPGAAVAVVEKGKLTKLAAYGTADLEWDGKVTPDTPFQLASVSKIFAGVVLMRMVEQGKLSLSDPLTKYFPQAPESWKAITIRHLAGHMSGLPEGLGQSTNATPLEVASEAMKRPLAYAPGSKSQYGFTDFVVMTAILEKVSGLSYTALLQREVLDPLGLKHTGFTMAREDGPIRSTGLIPGRAKVYAWRAPVQRDEAFLYPVHAYAAGGLYSSARDMATLMTALTHGGFLKPESFALLTHPIRLNDGRNGEFGVGWTFGRYHGLETVGHTGGPGLGDVMYIPSADLVVIALTNQRRFVPLLSQAIADLKLPPSPVQPAIADSHPEFTADFTAQLAAARDGKLDEARFTAEGARDWLPFYKEFGQAMLEAVGPVSKAELLSERAKDSGGLRRLYRVVFARKTMLMVASTDGNGRYTAIVPLSGDDTER